MKIASVEDFDMNEFFFLFFIFANDINLSREKWYVHIKYKLVKDEKLHAYKREKKTIILGVAGIILGILSRLRSRKL